MADSLTHQEHEALDILATFFNLMSNDICAHGSTRNQDMKEVSAHVYTLQRIVLSQSAARNYPEKYRLLGQRVEVDEKKHKIDQDRLRFSGGIQQD